MGWLLGMALVAAGVAGVVAWAVARRYGRWAGLSVPVMALLATALMMWRTDGMSAHDGMGSTLAVFVFAVPSLLGAFLGLVLARLRRG